MKTSTLFRALTLSIIILFGSLSSCTKKEKKAEDVLIDQEVETKPIVAPDNYVEDDDDEGLEEINQTSEGLQLKCPEGNCPSFVSFLSIEGKYACTGVLVDDKYVLTNSHCLDKTHIQGDSCEGVQAYFLNKGKETIKVGCKGVKILHLERNPVDTLDAKDYALIELEGRPSKVESVEVDPNIFIEDFEEVLIHTSNFIDSRTVNLKTHTCIYRAGTFHFPHGQNHFSPYMLLAKCPLKKGNSGSAVTNKRKVLAGLVYTRSQKSDRTAEEEEKLLEENIIVEPKELGSQGVSSHCINLTPFVIGLDGKKCNNQNHKYEELSKQAKKEIGKIQRAILYKERLTGSFESDSIIEWENEGLTVEEIVEKEITFRDFFVPKCVEAEILAAKSYEIKFYFDVKVRSKLNSLYVFEHLVTGKEVQKENPVFVLNNQKGGYSVRLGLSINGGQSLFKNVPPCSKDAN